MKKLLTSVLALFLSTAFVFGQQLTSGEYEYGLKLSYDSSIKKVTGYFESYTGLDWKTNTPKFSCFFYIEGKVTGQTFIIKTYYPEDKEGDLIEGTMEIENNNTVRIKLPEEHGGCWNVWNFANDQEPAEFTLLDRHHWLQIRYVDINKTYFHSSKTTAKQLKSYLVKGDIVCIEKIDQGWAYCIYYGKKTSKGWIKLSELNKI